MPDLAARPGSEFQVAGAATEKSRMPNGRNCTVQPLTLNGEQVAPGRAEMALSGDWRGR